MYLDNNTYDFNVQLQDNIKVDKKTGESISRWEEKKLKTLPLADSYKRLGNYKKSARVRDCGSFLEFREYVDSGEFKLHHANFCKVRLCPMCSWRRSMKIFGQVSNIMDNVKGRKKYIFLTLTVKNCSSVELEETINSMYAGFKRFQERKRIKDSFLGWFRCLEVTYNKQLKNYHPHFHIILCANSNYFKSDDYIEQNEFVEIWKDCMRLDYTPVVHVEKVVSRRAVCEVAKYTVKDTDYSTQKGFAIDHVVATLDSALANRRLCALGGIFKEIAKELKLDNMEDGNLVNVTGEEVRNDVNYIVHKFGWHVGYNAYYGLKTNDYEDHTSSYQKRANPDRLKYLK